MESPGRSAWSQSLTRLSSPFVSSVNSFDPAPHVQTEYVFDTTINQDMDSPLSHFFISSGHNSYLISDQIVGPSGTYTIEKSLLGGCRMVELDVYNGNEDEGPICKHGGTATRPVPFKDCVAAIRQHAWTASSYPVIITLENHTDAQNQMQMVRILQEVLGSALFIPPPGEHIEWLSPAALVGKFLIRCKLKEAIEELKSIVYLAISKFQGFEIMSSLPHVTSSSVKEGKVEAFVKSIKQGAGPMGQGGRFSFRAAFHLQTPPAPTLNLLPPLVNHASPAKPSDVAQAEPSKEHSNEEIIERPAESRDVATSSGVEEESIGILFLPTASQTLDVELGSQVTPAQPSPSPPLKQGSTVQEDHAKVPAASKAPSRHSQSGVLPSSLSRTSGGSSTSSYCTIQEVYAYSRRHILRVYPAAWKVDSRNFDPSPAWSLGACAVALNWQTWDKAMWVNQGWFRVNGNCGYVKKPLWMIQGEEEGSPPSPPVREPRTLRVHIYSACIRPVGRPLRRIFVPCSSGSPSQDSISFKVWLKGMPTDSGKRIISSMDLGNGKLRIETTFDFKMCYPEMAVLLFIAKQENDGDDGGLSYFSIPLATLRVGRYKLVMFDGKSGKQVASNWMKVALSWDSQEELR